jgi:SSS family solute:Na+ symporter
VYKRQGIYWRKTSPRGAIWSMIITAGVGLFWVAYKAIYNVFPIHPNLTETYVSVLTSFVMTILLSYMMPKEKENTLSV